MRPDLGLSNKGSNGKTHRLGRPAYQTRPYNAVAKKGGKLGQRARLAKVLKGFRKGGY